MLGDHGSVGGGGDVTALSSIGLSWILDGAEAQGLAFKAKALQVIAKQQDPSGSLRNSTEPPSLMARALAKSARDREGPANLDEVHPSVLARLAAEIKSPEGARYNPGSLAQIDRAELLAAAERFGLEVSELPQP